MVLYYISMYPCYKMSHSGFLWFSLVSEIANLYILWIFYLRVFEIDSIQFSGILFISYFDMHIRKFSGWQFQKVRLRCSFWSRTSHTYAKTSKINENWWKLMKIKVLDCFSQCRICTVCAFFFRQIFEIGSIQFSGSMLKI